MTIAAARGSHDTNRTGELVPSRGCARSAGSYEARGRAAGRWLDRLRFIRATQALGLSLGEIRSIVAMRDSGQIPCGHVIGLLRDRSEDIRATIRELRALQSELDRLVERARDLDP